MRREQVLEDYSAPSVHPGNAGSGLRGKADSRVGVSFGLAAYLWWGFTPVYFKAIAVVPVGEIIAHRIIWSWALLAVVLCATRRWSVFMRVIRSHRKAGAHAATAALLFGSWFGFVWAVANGHVLQISLAYFISPLVKMLLGVLFLHERVRRWQAVSVMLAVAGVAYLTVRQGQLPVLALSLALVMNLYIMLRKMTSLDGVTGLGLEMTFVLLPALAYILWAWRHGELVFGRAPAWLDTLLALSGVITTLPLVWVVSAVRRIRLVTLGFIQYIMPSIHFLLAIVAYREPCTLTHLVCFACVWTAVAVYSLGCGMTTARRGWKCPYVCRSF